MTIKITGTTVINDSRELENISDVDQFVRAPTITSPTEGSTTDSGLSPVIVGTGYDQFFSSDSRDYREFQVDLATGDFSSPIRTNQVDADSWAVDPLLDPDTEHKIRIRDVSVRGAVSEFSEVVTFTTANIFVDEPTVSVEGGPSDVPEEPQITTSAFSVTGDTDTHESTDWEVVRTSDSVVVFSSTGDTSNLTSITVTTPLDVSEEYEFRARHNGATFGASSFGSTTATTAAVFYAPTTLGESGKGGFYMGTICAAGTCYYLIVAPNSSGCACCDWKTSNTSTSGTSDLCDGFDNTYNSLTNSSHPAGGTCRRLKNSRCSMTMAAGMESVIRFHPGRTSIPITTGRRRSSIPLTRVASSSTLATSATTATTRHFRTEFARSAGSLFNLFTYLLKDLLINYGTVY